MATNIFADINDKIAKKTITDTLSSYVQSSCSVNITDEGYHIYRPANLTYTNNNVMWGGFRIYNHDNVYKLQQGHTYIIKFHVKGKTSNAAATIGWSNNMGWGGGGLSPSPSNVSYNYPPANFQGEMECFYKFTINDTVYKTCTSAYSSFVAGNSYVSYRDFQCGWGYQSTGALGTDIYITNVRMYDITSGAEKVDIKTTSIVDASDFQESLTNENKARVYDGGTMYSNQIIEL